MKCANCGAELRLGSIFCAACGHEAQIVSHSGLLEEELLRDLLKEEPEEEKETENEVSQGNKKKKMNPKKQKMIFFLFFFSFLFILLLGMGITIFFQNKQKENSYEYQVEQAELSVQEKNYTKALEYYQRSLQLIPEEEEVEKIKYRMSEIYFLMEEESPAIALLKEMIQDNPESEKAYRRLIAYYHEREDFSEILKMKEEVKSEEIHLLFSPYEAKKPQFQREPGTYPEPITIPLVAEENTEIYYTFDGSDPVENGELYEKPLEIQDQKTVNIRAVAQNIYGVYSQEIQGSFTVRFQKPAMPKAMPDRGTFYEPTKVELTGPLGSHIYYTWDGSIPTTESSIYTEPLEIPEGDWILSAILVDQYGMTSNVLKCNYKYLPQEILEW